MESKKNNNRTRKLLKKANGVTMLALVVTIIVLLILAAITLNLAVGENGIIERAKLARDKSKNASIAEEEAMNEAAGEIDNAGNGGSSGGGTGEGGTCPECPDVSELENTIKELQNTIASLEQQLANEKANKAELEKQIADLNKQIEELKNEIEAQKEQIADLEGQLASKNEELARKDETIKNLQETVNNLNKQIEELNRQIETLKAKQATGNALVSEVLAGKTFSNSSGVGLVGTMTNNGALNANLNAGQSFTVPAGYTTGGTITANSIASQTQGTAVAGDILAGKTAWVNGQKVQGILENINGSDNADTMIYRWGEIPNKGAAYPEKSENYIIDKDTSNYKYMFLYIIADNDANGLNYRLRLDDSVYKNDEWGNLSSLFHYRNAGNQSSMESVIFLDISKYNNVKLEIYSANDYGPPSGSVYYTCTFMKDSKISNVS